MDGDQPGHFTLHTYIHTHMHIHSQHTHTHTHTYCTCSHHVCVDMLEHTTGATTLSECTAEECGFCVCIY